MSDDHNPSSMWYPKPHPRSGDPSDFDTIYTECGRINWLADQIKASQVQIELAARRIEAGQGVVPTPQPPVEPPPVTPPPLELPPSPVAAPLLHKQHLVHIGAFLLPADKCGTAANGFEYALTGFTFNPQHSSLYVNNHIYEQKTAEVTIPAPSTNWGALPRASYMQEARDIAEGRIANLGAGGAPIQSSCQMGGLHVYGSKIIGTSYVFYDGGKQAQLSHFTSGHNLATPGDVIGFYQVGDIGAGFVGGYMCSVPPEWQAALGGPCLTGQGCLSIISRTSYGPGAHVFDPGQIGGTGVVPATPLVYYPQDHPTLGPWEQQSYVNNLFNMGTRVNGMCFPVGSKSLLVFGCQGLGIPCYGDVTSYGGHCQDPTNSDKGCHAYPYAVWCWAYNVDELLLVKSGHKHPWDIVPYEVWQMDVPYMAPDAQVQGIAYDPLTQRIYLSHVHAEYCLPNANPYAKSPVVHVYQVTAPTGGLLTI